MNDKELLEQLGVTDIDTNTNDYLKHYGVLGMKWGIRRYQPYSKGGKGRYLGKKENIDRLKAKKNKSKTKKSSGEKLTGSEKKQIKQKKNEILNQTIEIESRVDKSIKPKNRKDITEVVTLSNEYISNNPKILPKGVNMKYDEKEVDSDDGAIHPIVTYNGKVVNFQAFSTSSNDRFLLEEPNVKKDDKIKHGDMDVDEYLKHFGILGMKWGIRRYQPYPKGEGHKGKFVNVRDSKKKAKEAGETARKNSIAKSREESKPGSRVTARKTNNKANKAGKVAERDSRKQTISENRELLKEKTKKEVKVNPAKKMTDDELRTVLNRLNMEKQYAQLTAVEKTKGQKMADEVLTNAAKQIATRFVMDSVEKVIKGK